MSYFSSTDPNTTLRGLSCGPKCSCGPCRSDQRGLSEWYEKEEPEPPPAPPSSSAAAPAAPGAVNPSQNGNGLAGWNRRGEGLGFSGYGRLGFYSQATAAAPARLVYPQVNAQLPVAGVGFGAYYASDSRGRPDNPPGYHRYGLREVIRAIEAIATEWHRRHGQGPRLGIGDISLLGGGPTPRHGAHQRGLEVDIRLPRSDGRELGVTFNDPNYSRSLTQELVDVINRNPILRVRVILFNDPGVSGVRAYPGHNDHLHVGFLPPAASTGPNAPAISNQTATPNVTVAMVSRMFPGTPLANIQTNLPFVLRALNDAGLGDKAMILMALASIRAETGNFTPLSEFQSRFNTPQGGPPFSLYDNRHDLGNQGPPDGANFRGRGFIQLTGRSNYQIHGAAIGLGNQLVTNPALANQPDIAAKLLASFLKRKEQAIRSALSTNNLALARRLVNGGSHGLQAFTAAYNIGRNVIP